MKKTTINFILFLFTFPFFAGAQKAETDSLLDALKSAPNDTNQVNAYNKLFVQLRSKEPFKAMDVAKLELAVAEKIKFQKGIGNSYNNFGLIYTDQGNYKRALEYHNKALKIREAVGEKSMVANSLNNIGTVYYFQGDHDKTMDFYLRSLRVREELNDKKGIANSYNNIGLLLVDEQNYDKALDYFDKALKTREEMNDKKGIAQSYNNFGIAYSSQKNFTKAIDYQLKALEILYQLGDTRELANALNNLGHAYAKNSDLNHALNYYLKSLDLRKDLGDREGITTSYINIAGIYSKQHDMKKSLDYFNRALEIAKEIGAIKRIRDSYEGLAEAYLGMGDYKNAYEYNVKYNSFKDTLLNETNSRNIAEMEAKFANEKKELDQEKEIEQLNDEKKHAELERNEFRLAAIGGIIGLLLVLSVAYFIYKGSRERHKTNLQLAEKNSVIEEKNKSITDSIHYAQRIQKAIITADNYLNKYLPDHFVLNKPKDIVSGDFYWCIPPFMVAQNIEKHILFATADCTGHGVPGAFMSIIGTSLLNKIVIAQKITQPDSVLNHLRDEIVTALNPEGSIEEAKDGMDMVLCKLDIKNMQLTYAAAYNSFYIVRDGAIIECDADKFPVGKFEGSDKPFTLHAVYLEKGDLIYTFTDGYADQFGGPNGKKFKYKQFQETLLAIHQKPMPEQKAILDKTISDWKGDLEQVDDILVIGIKV